MDNVLIFLVHLSIWVIPLLLLTAVLIMEFKDVHIAVEILAEQYGIRKQKWWEGGAAYEKYVKEEMINIRTHRLMRQIHRRIL